MLLQVCRLMGNMFVLPIHFSEEHKNMLGYTKRLLEYNGGGIAINQVQQTDHCVEDSGGE
jgi:hypothetical protein